MLTRGIDVGWNTDEVFWKWLHLWGHRAAEEAFCILLLCGIFFIQSQLLFSTKSLLSFPFSTGKFLFILLVCFLEIHVIYKIFRKMKTI